MSHKHQEQNHDEEPDMIRPGAAAEEAAAEQCNAEPEEEPLKKEVEKLKGELAEAQEKLIYLQADYQNYRKRVSKDITDARVYGAANALEPFITVYDYLTMARQAAEKSDKIEQIRQGLGMIIDQYMKAFEESGVSRVETVGAPFDPTVHEAVAREASDEYPEGIILKEWTGGYRFGQRLLRPAKVVVSSGPAGEAPAEKEA
ncbi:MAG: nucleotide exchange factor GrpE [Lentisphaeria bacterium]|nr:nucleotide exchange factor GrpE [Lentisphaeria bacterium]